MGRVMRVVVAGSKRVGKTACLEQLACVNDITKQYVPTIDDTYQVQMDYGDRPKEIMVFHDTGGISDYGPIELKKPYIQVADAFVLVYSVNDHETFNRMDMLKKYIEKQFGKEKKEVVDTDFAVNWAAREKGIFSVRAPSKDQVEKFVLRRHFHPQRESKFSLSKKLKPEKANAAIVMDF
ncbi:unnamed protein product [Enterobius vermicularis]|uniref:NF-kappa-B inhibitor-interacting Ras-like protein n=1 Tax=Enterobius vermicularis TaxID=51028 RepID=A0A0N4V7T4_ENTVE|nr:unnamed protein product [Enterobius vermicularis]